MPPPELEVAALDPVGRFLHRAAVVVAGIGGLALLMITALTIASVVGREVFSTPIPGDFELVEIGCAIAVFAFFPYCQMVGGNVIVDLFTTWTSVRTRALLDLIANLAFTLIAAVLTWRTAAGAADLMHYGEQTMVLRVPLWVGLRRRRVRLRVPHRRLRLHRLAVVRPGAVGVRFASGSVNPMTTFALGVVSFPVMLVLMALRIPIGLAMILVGGGGYVVVNGLSPLLHYLKTSPYFLFNSYSLSVIPLFILMGSSPRTPGCRGPCSRPPTPGSATSAAASPWPA